MTALNAFISDITAVSHSKITFRLETSYGLTLQIDHCAEQTTKMTISVGLRPNSEFPNNDQTLLADSSTSKDDAQQSIATPSKKADGHRYKYRVFPDWGAGFVWYDTTWPGTPEGEYLVDDDTILERYGEAWMSAYTAWSGHYTRSFTQQECDLGSHKHPFPDVRDRKKWVLDGMMLVVWLCIQPDVVSVDYSPDVENHVFTKVNLVGDVRSFLENLDSFLT